VAWQVIKGGPDKNPKVNDAEREYIKMALGDEKAFKVFESLFCFNFLIKVKVNIALTFYNIFIAQILQ
jgi:hypothetical protein